MFTLKLYDNGETIFRVLSENGDSFLVINCVKRTMPFWIKREEVTTYRQVDEQTLYDKAGLRLLKEDELSQQALDSEKLRMNLLPRTTGTFSRKGLTVNGLRYKRDGYTERFLKGGSCVVSYDPDNVSTVWLVEGGKYVEFELIESRFTSKSLEEVINIQHQVKELTTVNEDEQLQSEIDLQQHITAIGNTAKSINKRVTLGEESNV